MLRHPTLVTPHGGGDAEGETFLPEQCVAAIARSIANDQPVFGKVRDIGILGITGPGDIVFSIGNRETHRVQALHKGTLLDDLRVDCRPHTGHGAHVRNDIGAVRDLDAVLGYRGSYGAHAEGNDVEDASPHAVFEESVELGLHDGGIPPVVGRTRILLRFAADEGAFLHAGHIAGITAYKERVGSLLGVEPKARPRIHDPFPHQPVLLLGSVAPEDRVGLCKRRHFVDPVRDHWNIREGRPKAFVVRCAHAPFVTYFQSGRKRHGGDSGSGGGIFGQRMQTPCRASLSSLVFQT